LEGYEEEQFKFKAGKRWKSYRGLSRASRGHFYKPYIFETRNFLRSMLLSAFCYNYYFHYYIRY